ncbi:cytosolic thiouridylase subunit Ctu1 [Chytriomyces hyalinus]|nr:cytosolic thiouridylase subunit Ctu1 [Chytriomyces hyalinus]
MYAYFLNLDYFSTECTYSVEAYRGYARVFLKDLEKVRPAAIMDIIHSGEAYQAQEGLEDRASAPGKQKKPAQKQGNCERCGYISSQKLCKACVLLETLNRGQPAITIG